MSLPKRSGYTFNRPQGVWVNCDRCEEGELFLGTDADAGRSAQHWADEHDKEHARGQA